MRGILSQPQPSWRNEYRHSGVQCDSFSMMYSSCLLLLNLRRKGLKPNTSVKSMNHSLFISFNWKKKEGEKKNCSLWSPLFFNFFFFFITTRRKKIQRSLSLSTHLFRSTYREPDWKRNLIRNGQKSERDTLHHGEVPRFSEIPHSSLFFFSPMSATLPLLFPSFPSPHLSSSPLPPPQHTHTHLPSSPTSPPPHHLPALTPDTVLPLRFHPFPAQPACCGGVVLLSYWLHILSPAFLTPTSALLSGLKEMDLSLACSLSAVCVSGGVCGWAQAVVSYPAKYA